MSLLHSQLAVAGSSLVLGAVLIFAASEAGVAQNPTSLRGGGTIAVRAVLPPTAKVIPSSASVLAVLPGQPSGGTSIVIPVELEWNVDRFTRQIQVIASFPHSQSALQDEFGHIIEAEQLELSTDGQSWKVFPARSVQGLSSGVLVSSENIDLLGRQGKKAYQMKLRFREGLQERFPARYGGLLEFRAVLQ